MDVTHVDNKNANVVVEGMLDDKNDELGLVKCCKCDGTGRISRYVSGGGVNGTGNGYWESRECPDCRGRGGRDCHVCGGDGWLYD